MNEDKYDYEERFEKALDKAVDQAIADEHSRLRTAVEKLKGWDHCLRHDTTDRSCLDCVNLHTINFTIDEVLTLLS